MHNEGGWDLQVLDEHFEPAMVEEIKKVKIGEVEGDWMYWKFDGSGKFSVKSAYLTEIGYYDPPPCKQGHDLKEWSRLVWNLKVPPKVKIFFWRVVNNLIPVTANLRRHHVPVSGLCDRCKKHWGTTIHSLFFCDKIKEVWKESFFWGILKKHRFGEISELCRDMQANKSKVEFESWVMTVWKVWRLLCLQKHEPEKEHDLVSIEMGKELLESYKEACSAVKHRWFFGVPLGSKIWKPPKQGVYRVDVDACFNENSMLFGVGVVIRNNSKELCAAMALPTNNPGNVLEAELNAMLYGMGLCLQENFGPVVLFSDSINAVRKIARMIKGDDEIEPGFEDLMELSKEGFILDICHMYREANSVAHTLARFGALSCITSCWTSNFPYWLRNIMMKD